MHVKVQQHLGFSGRMVEELKCTLVMHGEMFALETKWSVSTVAKWRAPPPPE